MIKKIAIVVLIILVSSLTLGCADQGVSGTYYKDGDPDSYIKLNEGDLYTLNESGYVYVGLYDYDSESVYIAAVMEAITLERNSSKVLVDPDGERWVRK